MFVGHYAVGLAAKKIAPRASMGALIAAPILLDLIWPFFLLLGWEHVAIEPNQNPFLRLEFISYPISHGLVAVAGWAILYAALYFGITRYQKGALVILLLVVSHWVLCASTRPAALCGQSRVRSGALESPKGNRGDRAGHVCFRDLDLCAANESEGRDGKVCFLGIHRRPRAVICGRDACASSGERESFGARNAHHVALRTLGVVVRLPSRKSRDRIILFQTRYYVRRRLIRFITATNSAAPMIDQIIGKFIPPTGIVNNSGRCRAPASHVPSSAPMNPSAIETRHPPCE